MTTMTGREGAVKQANYAVAEVTQFECDIQNEVVDDTSMGDLWRTKKPMHNSWTASVECHYDPSDTNGQNAFAIGTEVTFNGFADTDQSGGAQLSGQAIVTGRRVMSPHDNLVSLSITLEGNGALTESLVT